MTEVTCGLIGVDKRVTVSMFINPLSDPATEMRAATKRLAQQGARNVTLYPRRDGKGWARKQQKEN